AGPAGDPVVAPAADEVVVLTVAEEDIVAGHAVDEVVARLAADRIAAADVIRGRHEVGTARGVVGGEELGGADDDALAAPVLKAGAAVVHEFGERPARGAVG